MMQRPIDLIPSEPGVDRLSIPRLSLREYNEVAREHVSYIDEVKQALDGICQPFQGQGTISPTRCVEAARTLNTLRNRVEQFCKQLEETSRLPLALLSLRYELFDLCYQIIEGADKLQDRINTYRKASASNSGSSLRNEIHAMLQNVVQLISDLSRQVEDHSEIARFQERRLLAVYEKALKS
jgi:hypothetical protein